MATKLPTKIYPTHKAAQAYLSERYGFRPYSDRHTKRLIKAGRFPAPVRLTPARRAWTREMLDQYAERILWCGALGISSR